MAHTGRIIAVFSALLVVQAASGEEFVWQRSGRAIGRLTVPTGFAIETRDYQEGIVTTLRYVDGALIVLQSGAMYQVPMFQGSGHELTSSMDLDLKTVRVGHIAGSTLCWREDNFKPMAATDTSQNLAALFPPNVAYAKVPQSRLAEFDQALDSFTLNIEGAPSQDAGRVRFVSMVSGVLPAYPVAAQKKGIHGAVWLDTVIGKDGHVVSVQRISGNPALVGAAEDAVLQRVYRPTTLNREPIRIIAKVCVPFVPPRSKQTPCGAGPER